MKKHRWQIVYLITYLLVNLLFLTQFPFVHSDEPWLSGLTRNMVESGSLSVTETFFNLHLRYPHAIKTLFHLLQMPFMAIFGYRIFSFRLISLLFGTASLSLYYALLCKIEKNRKLALWGTVLLSLDLQFIYSAHIARPEAIILTVMLGVYALLLSKRRHAVLLAAIVTGISIGIHPNSFLVAVLGVSVILTRSISQSWLITLKELGIFTAVVGVFCTGFVLLSFSFDGDFIRHYLAYGSEFQVDATLAGKLREIVPYFQRLFYGVSGTYYTPDIRLQLLLFPLIILVGALTVLFGGSKQLLSPIAAIAGILAGMTLVGRFSQPYVVFFFPFAYLLLIQLLALIPKHDRLKRSAARLSAGAIAIICLALLSFSVANIGFALKAPSYDSYLAQIAEHVPADAKTIGNLNAEYHFENGVLLDYRNLTHIREAGLSFEDYAEKNGVEYLIISDELQLIYELRPNWNGIYGNVNYLDELNHFLETKCTLVSHFVDNQYGVRIAGFQNTERDFNISVYRRKPLP